MKENDKIYRSLQEHLDNMPIGFPRAESGADLKVLKAFFTPEEAELATYLNFTAVPLNEIYSRCKYQMRIQELQEKLDKMVEKGIIFSISPLKSKIKSYGNLPYAIGFFEEHVNRLTKDMAEASEEYGLDFIREFLGEKTGIPQMRTVPVNAAISHENLVQSYDNARKILDAIEGPFAVAPCVCVQSKELAGYKCKHDMVERCMVNNQGYIDNGNAREITKHQAFEILEKAEEIGLVIQPGNTKQPGGFCLCCGCCCGILTYGKKLEEPARVFATNFYSEVETETCTGCGTCEEFCPMDAIIVDEVARISRDRCIGCGVCVSKCPTSSIHLRNKKQVKVPPENGVELISKLIKKKSELRSA